MIKHSQLCILAYSFALLTWSSFAWSDTSIAAEGETIVVTTLKTAKVVATVHTTRIASNSDCYALVADGTPSGDVRVISVLAVSLNGVALHVPRSSFADITQPAMISIKPLRSGFRLVISGGDASEAYAVELDFDSEKVTRRRLFSLLTPKQPTEETRYRLMTLKDE